MPSEESLPGVHAYQESETRMMPDYDPEDEDDEYIPWDVDRVYDFGDFEDDSEDD